MHQKLPNLDPLRFFLASMVLFLHVPFMMTRMGFSVSFDFPFFHRGLEAVNFFFSLSGFLIIRLLYIEKSTLSKINIANFYRRRILRIYPLYYLVFITGVVLYHFLLPSLDIEKPTNYSFGSLIFHYVFLMPNIFANNHAVGSILNILWSIGLEEQFYLFIPVVLYFLPARYFIGALSILLAAYLLIFFNTDWLIRNGLYFYYFLFGGLLSVVSYTHSLQRFFRYRILSIFLLAAFILYFFTDLLFFKNFVAYHLTAMLLSGLFILMIGDYPLFVIKSKALNYLGKISYGIYMYHMIICTGLVFIIRYLFDLRAMNGTLIFLGTMLVEFLLTILVAHLSYKYFESFFLNLKKGYRPRIFMKTKKESTGIHEG